jgi:release factor glutamine methyltransferase
MKVQEVLEKTTSFFKDKGISSARLDAELLMAQALNWQRIDLYLKHDQPLTEAELQACRNLVRRRSAGEPIAYIRGEKDFYGLTFKVDESVLVPRPETELIVEQALEFPHPIARLLDIGCGSGCIGIAILKNLARHKATQESGTSPQLKAVDISPESIEIARANAKGNAVAEHCEFFAGDFEKWFETHGNKIENNGRFDLVVSTPPYLDSEDSRVQKEVRQFEPARALFAEDHGLRFVKKWASLSFMLLTEGGLCLFEIGADQGPAAEEAFRAAGFQDIRILKDLAGLDRVVRGTRGQNG